MPQKQQFAGFTPDPEPDMSGFIPDPVEPSGPAPDPSRMSDLERQVLGLPPKSDYMNMWDTAASYIPSPVKSAWESIWTPTTDITSRAGKAVSDYLDPTQYGHYDPRRYLSAYPEAVGNVLTGLTSPGNLALTAATGGAGAARSAVAQRALPVVAPKVAQGLTTAGRAIGGATAAHGAQTIADPRTTMLEKGFGALEVVGGGMAARAPRPTAAPIAAVDEAAAAMPDTLPIPPRAAPIEPAPIAKATPPPIEPAPSSFGADRWDEIQQKIAQGIADEDDLIDLEVIRRVSGSGKVTPAPKPPVPTQAEQFTQSVLGGEVRPPPMANLADFSPEGLAEMNKFMGEGTPAMTPAQAAEGMAQPPTTNVEAFLQSMKQGEAPPQQAFDPGTLEFVDPKTGEIIPATRAKPGDVPLPVRPPEVAAQAPVPEEVLATVGRSQPPEVRGQVGGQSPPSVAADTPRLPKELQGAKPRFNVGADSYFPNFADDLDKALYIIGQTNKSKADAQYLKFVMEQTGLSEEAARNAGAQVKAAIKQAAQGKETGKIDIPPIMRERLAAQGGGAGKPPVKPPVATGGEAPVPEGGPKQTPKEFLEGKPQVDTGPVVPGNVGVSAADEVVTSLTQRMQRAVDNAGTPNAIAADDISKLMDEAAEVINKMPEGAEKQGVIRQVLAANKALLTSWDLSAPGRQGKAFIFNKSWWTSLDDMVKAWGSKSAADNINQSIMDHPSGYFTKPVSETGKVGKSFAEKAGLDLASTEEMFKGVVDRAAGKIPLVARSGRAHTAFLNKLRSDQFVSFMEQAKAAGMNPEVNLELAKKYATFINDATGRGSVNIGRVKLERITGGLNDVFFAPKNMAGQIRTWNNVLNPVKYYNYDPVLRKQALKSLMAVAGAGLAVGEVARIAGANVSNDPTSSDFRKIKIGDTRIDMFGGYQQFPVAMMKFLSGQQTSTVSGKTTDLTAGRYGQPTRETVAERFFTNRLSPAGSFIWAWMSNREFDGKPFEAKRALYERVFPIAAKDLLELYQEDPAVGAILTPTTIMGLTGTQTYSGR